MWIAGLFIAAMFATAYATYDSHVHTGNGPLDTYPTITVTGTHKIRVCAPTVGNIQGYSWISGSGVVDQATARNGSSQTSSGYSFNQGANVLFSSWVWNYGGGTGKAYFADTGTTMPNCGTESP
ncbi:MAG: hypothetical protein IPG71_03430 [bacterium]|nr:hypothetical protein [bacterium]